MSKYHAGLLQSFIATAICMTGPYQTAHGQDKSLKSTDNAAAAQAPTTEQANRVADESKKESSLTSFFQIQDQSSELHAAGEEKPVKNKDRSGHGVLWHLLDYIGVPLFFTGNSPLLDPALRSGESKAQLQSSVGPSLREASDLRPELPGGIVTPQAVLRENKIPEAELEGPLFETGTNSNDKANSR